MNKLLFFLLIMIIAAVPAYALGQSSDCTAGSTGSELCNPITGVSDIPGLIIWAFGQLAVIITTIVFIMLLYGGAQMIFSSGDPQKVTQAKGTLTYAVAGLVLVVFAYVIVTGVLYFLNVGNNISPGQTGSTGFFVNPLGTTSYDIVVWNTVNRVLGIIGTIALLYIVIGGFRYIMAGGNEEQVKQARSTITWAIAGLVIVILSYTIVSVIVRTLN